jgi:hypothetical protein
MMFKKSLIVSALAGIFAFSTGFALAADQDRDQTRDQIQDKTQDQTRDRIYGSQLMTQQERNEYRARMRSAQSLQEREQIRAEHHERMRVRAKERGVMLPDQPPARGRMMGPGGGMGPGSGGMGGMGPGGGGMAPGGGMGPGGR